MSSPLEKPHVRWAELDGVRGFAALLVVYAHLFLTWVPGSPSLVFWMRTATGVAWTGVYLFFILSGFLIGGILLQQRSAANYFSVFYTRRALRIFPPYFLLLIAYAVIRHGTALGTTPAFSSNELPFWQYPLLVQNFPMALTGNWGAPSLGVTWSVALEEHFYLFLPLWIRWFPARWLLPSFAVLALGGIVFRATMPLAHSAFLMPGALEALFGGTILAWAWRHRPDFFQRTRWRVAAAGLLLAGAVGMALIVTRVKVGIFDVTIFTMFWGAFLWLVLSFMGTPWTALLRTGWLRWVGSISYGVYLFHPIIHFSLFTLVTGDMPKKEYGAVNGFLLTTASFALVLAFSSLLFWLVERRLIGLGQQLKYTSATPSKELPKPLMQTPA